MKRNQDPRGAPAGCEVSLQACEMEAEVRVYLRNRNVSAEEVAAELQRESLEKRQHGMTGMGKASLWD